MVKFTAVYFALTFISAFPSTTSLASLPPLASTLYMLFFPNQRLKRKHASFREAVYNLAICMPAILLTCCYFPKTFSTTADSSFFSMWARTTIFPSLSTTTNIGTANTWYKPPTRDLPFSISSITCGHGNLSSSNAFSHEALFSSILTPIISTPFCLLYTSPSPRD